MTKDKIEDTESRDIKMVDELFEGALSGNEGFFPSPRTESPLTVASLTRQKSRLEVRCELTAVSCLMRAVSRASCPDATVCIAVVQKYLFFNNFFTVEAQLLH